MSQYIMANAKNGNGKWKSINNDYVLNVNLHLQLQQLQYVRVNC